MTGGEIVPIGAAARAAAEALSEKEWQTQRLAQIAEDTPEMKAAAVKYAKRIEIKQGVMLRLYQPLARLIGFQKEYFSAEFARDMAQRTMKIPEEELVAPSPILAFPAMTGLGYSLEEPDLKEMYLNLLATATDGRRQMEAHPAFAEIIRQLTPSEADALLAVLREQVYPIVRMHRIRDTGGYAVACQHILPLVRQGADEYWVRSLETEVWVDNWIRLGLVEASYDVKILRDGVYDWVDDHPDVREQRATVPEGESSKTYQGRLGATGFGRRFFTAVSSGEPAQDSDPGDAAQPRP